MAYNETYSKNKGNKRRLMLEKEKLCRRLAKDTGDHHLLASDHCVDHYICGQNMRGKKDHNAMSHKIPKMYSFHRNRPIYYTKYRKSTRGANSNVDWYHLDVGLHPGISRRLRSEVFCKKYLKYLNSDDLLTSHDIYAQDYT